MSKLKTALYCSIGLAVVGLGFGFMSYLRVKEEPKALHSALHKESDVSLNRIHHVATRDGIKEWTLDAESAQYEKADNKTVFKDLVATFFLEDGNIIRTKGLKYITLPDNWLKMEYWEKQK